MVVGVGPAASFHEPGHAHIGFGITCPYMYGGNFAPNASVDVTVRSAPGGPVIFTGTFATDGFGNWNFEDCVEVNFNPGHEATVTDGASTKVLLAAAVDVTHVRIADDVVTGTASPGESVQVFIDAPGDPNIDTVAGGDGTWSVDFTSVYDITSRRDQAYANVYDDDGDATYASGGPPTVRGFVGTNVVEGFNFDEFSNVTLQVYDGATELLSTSVPTIDNGAFWFEWDGGTLAAGNRVRASDGTHTQEVLLQPLTWDVNGFAGQSSGTAPAGASVVLEQDSYFDPGMATTAGADGVWTLADRFDPGAAANIYEADGDTTAAFAPPFPTIEGNLSFGSISGCGFARDGSVNVAIYDAPGGVLLASGSHPTDGDTCLQDGGFHVDIAAGMFVRVTGGPVVKELTLVQLSIYDIDLLNDRVSGTAAPNTTFNVDFDTVGDGSGWVGQNVTSDAAGDWMADFGALGLDLRPCLSHVGANVGDGDGDQTAFDRAGPCGSIEGNLSFGSIGGCGFILAATVAVEIYDVPGGALLASGEHPTDLDGCLVEGGFHVDFALLPGMFARVSDSAHAKELTLATLSIDEIDSVNDTASGTAPPNTTFNVDVFTPDGWVSIEDGATSDETGAWTADFGAQGIDLRYTGGEEYSHVGANVDDGDQDQTAYDASITPDGGVQSLKDEVNSLVASGELTRAQGNGLNRSLDNALADLGGGGAADALTRAAGGPGAVDHLEDFVTRVNRLVRRGKLSQTSAGPLLHTANQLIAALSA